MCIFSMMLRQPDAGVVGAEADLALLCGVGDDALLGAAEAVVGEGPGTTCRR